MFKSSITARSRLLYYRQNTCGMQLLYSLYAKNTISLTILLAKTSSIKGTYTTSVYILLSIPGSLVSSSGPCHRIEYIAKSNCNTSQSIVLYSCVLNYFTEKIIYNGWSQLSAYEID